MPARSPDCVGHAAGEFRPHTPMKRWLVCLMLLCCAGPAVAQRPVAPTLPLRSVMLSGGMSWPLSRQGLTEYWRAGPDGGVEFDVRVRRRFLVGMGIDAAALLFRASRFVQNHPGVVLRNTPVAQVTVALTGRMEFFPEKRFGPYLGLSVGASRLSAAVYQEVVDSVRVTYYSIPGRTRLSAGGNAGVVFHATRWLGFEAECRLLYVHNDPDTGVSIAFRSGVRFNF